MLLDRVYTPQRQTHESIAEVHPRQKIIMKRVATITLSILVILFGVFLIGYGGYDDSPGAQGIGVLLVILGIIGVVKSKKKT